MIALYILRSRKKTFKGQREIGPKSTSNAARFGLERLDFSDANLNLRGSSWLTSDAVKAKGHSEIIAQGEGGSGSPQGQLREPFVPRL